MTQKQKVDFPSPAEVIVKLGRADVYVKPYLGHREQIVLSALYVKEYFSQDARVEERAFNAENSLFLGILDLCTSIKVTDGEKDSQEALFSLDDIFANYDFVKSVRSAIKNYGEFRATLHKAIDEIKFEKSNVALMANTVVERVIEFLNDFSLDDATAERLSALLKEANSSEVLKIITSKIK